MVVHSSLLHLNSGEVNRKKFSMLCRRWALIAHCEGKISNACIRQTLDTLLAVQSCPRIYHGGIKLPIGSLGTYIAFTSSAQIIVHLLFAT